MRVLTTWKRSGSWSTGISSTQICKGGTAVAAALAHTASKAFSSPLHVLPVLFGVPKKAFFLSGLRSRRYLREELSGICSVASLYLVPCTLYLVPCALCLHRRRHHDVIETLETFDVERRVHHAGGQRDEGDVPFRVHPEQRAAGAVVAEGARACQGTAVN